MRYAMLICVLVVGCGNDITPVPITDGDLTGVYAADGSTAFTKIDFGDKLTRYHFGCFDGESTLYANGARAIEACLSQVDESSLFGTGYILSPGLRERVSVTLIHTENGFEVTLERADESMSFMVAR